MRTWKPRTTTGRARDDKRVGKIRIDVMLLQFADFTALRSPFCKTIRTSEYSECFKDILYGK